MFFKSCYETGLFENSRTGLVTHKITAKHLNSLKIDIFLVFFVANLIGINWNRVKIGTFLLFQQWNIHNKHPINCYKFFQWLFFKFFNCICKTAVCGPFWTKMDHKTQSFTKITPSKWHFFYFFANLIDINEIKV